MNEELISIIIPCYNHEKFMADCLESILAQDYPNIELIICDDCSTDDSRKVIEKYRKKLMERLTRTVIIQNEKNLGLTRTLNQMIKLANGTFIKTLASDDFLDTSYCSKAIEFFLKNPDIDILVCNGEKVEERSTWQNLHIIKSIYDEQFSIPKENMFKQIYDRNFISAPTVILRKQIYDKFGLYDENCYIEDWEYWLRIAKEQSVTFGYLSDKVVYYRINENSMTSASGSKEKVDVRRVRLHAAEMSIIAKYGSFVSSAAYANRKMDCIITEYLKAVGLQLEKTYEITEEEYQTFDMWSKLTMTQRLQYKYWHWKNKYEYKRKIF